MADSNSLQYEDNPPMYPNMSGSRSLLHPSTTSMMSHHTPHTTEMDRQQHSNQMTFNFDRDPVSNSPPSAYTRFVKLYIFIALKSSRAFLSRPSFPERAGWVLAIGSIVFRWFPRVLRQLSLVASAKCLTGQSQCLQSTSH